MMEIAALVAVGALGVGGVLARVAPPRWAAIVAGLAFAASVAGAVPLIVEAFNAGEVVAGGGIVRLDGLSAYLAALVLLVGGIALLASPRYVAAEVHHGAMTADDPPRYYALVLWFLACLVAVPLVDSLGLLWVGLEGATAVSALLVGFHRTPAALEAAWKYLIIGSLGIGFALLGTVLLYASTVATFGEAEEALNWSFLAGNAVALDPTLVRLGFVFVLVGYGTKAGLAPFHTWLPDAHSQAPSPVSALLSGATLAIGLYALIRVHLVSSAALGPGFSSGLLVAFGLLSLAVALPFLIAQGDLKRLLAYSSIEHMGLLALAVGFGGRLALLGATLHLLGHALAKSTAFIAAGDLVQRQGTRRLGRLRDGVRTAPGSSWPLLAAVLVLGGLPPSATFTAEVAILLGGIEEGWLPAAIAAAILLGVAFAAVSFHVLRIAWAGAGERGTGKRKRTKALPAPSAQPGTPRHGRARALLLATPLAAVVVMGVWLPGPLGAAIDAVVAVLSGGRALS